MWPRPNAQLSRVDVYVWHYDYVSTSMCPEKKPLKIVKTKADLLGDMHKNSHIIPDLARECDRHNQTSMNLV